MKKVMVFGTFDVLHLGHLFLFNEAKKYGDVLIVVVARDKTVRILKGHKTTFHEKQRLRAVQSLPIVNVATLGHHRDVYKVLEEYTPDVLCLGYDQRAFTDKLEEELKKRKIQARIIRIAPFKQHEMKSSLIKKRVKNVNPTFLEKETIAPQQKTKPPKTSTSRQEANCQPAQE